VIERCTFADLDAVDLFGRHIILWGKGKRLLADISLSDTTAHDSLLGALRSVGKLA
jgi:predicted GNAT family N-acyltransferase